MEVYLSLSLFYLQIIILSSSHLIQQNEQLYSFFHFSKIVVFNLKRPKTFKMIQVLKQGYNISRLEFNYYIGLGWLIFVLNGLDYALTLMIYLDIIKHVKCICFFECIIIHNLYSIFYIHKCVVFPWVYSHVGWTVNWPLL